MEKGTLGHFFWQKCHPSPGDIISSNWLLNIGPVRQLQSNPQLTSPTVKILLLFTRTVA